MRRLASACLLAAGAATQPWQAWLSNFGHDSYQYPAWVAEQMGRCECQQEAASFRCTEDGRYVDWRAATELTWCIAKHFLLCQMPEFDLQFLPPAVTVQGTSMLDDNIAFTLMAWRASALSPRPPVRLALAYLLPYATYHESRTNWRPLFFAKYFASAATISSSQGVVDALISEGTRLMNWTSFRWPDFGGRSPGNVYELGPFAPGSTPPAISPFDVTAYGFASCTGWAKFLASALKAVGVPAREVGAPCWNTAEFTGLAVANSNVSLCWNAGQPGGPYGGRFLNNHNWVEYWDNLSNQWRFLDVATSSSSESTWFCGTFSGGCECSQNAGKASKDHEILAPTWSPVDDDPEFNGGEVLDVARSLKLSTGQPVSPLVWSPLLRSPLGKALHSSLRMVNRTEFYRCKPEIGSRIQLSG